MHLSAARRGIQTPFMKWFTQFLGHRTAPTQEYMRYADTQSARTYPARTAPPSQNEKLHGKLAIFVTEHIRQICRGDFALQFCLFGFFEKSVFLKLWRF